MSEALETPATDHLTKDADDASEMLTTDGGVRDVDPASTPATTEDQTGDRATGLTALGGD